MAIRSTYLFVVALLSLCGCERGPDIVPVSGTITIDGKPLTTGNIIAYQKGFRPATAMIQNDGSFTFRTFTNGDGCVLGEHLITVDAVNVIDDSRAEHLVPHRYSDANQSDAKINIESATSVLRIDLTWQGSGHTKPYVVNSSAGR